MFVQQPLLHQVCEQEITFEQPVTIHWESALIGSKKFNQFVIATFSNLTLKLPGVRSKFITKFILFFFQDCRIFCRCFQLQSTHTALKKKCRNLEYQKKSALGIFLSFKFKVRAIGPSPAALGLSLLLNNWVLCMYYAHIGSREWNNFFWHNQVQ